MSYESVRGRGLGSSRNGMPVGRGYVYRGDQSPGAARLRARITARLAELDPGGPGLDDVGYEWRREQLAELEEPPAHVIPLQAPAVEPPAPVIVTPGPPPAAARCPVCRYLTTSIGHRVNCDA